MVTLQTPGAVPSPAVPGTRQHIHRETARHVRDRVLLRFTPPEEDNGPSHYRDGDGWMFRHSPGEAEEVAVAVIEPALTVTVNGTPAGQGRISYNQHGRGYHSNGKRLRPWRKAIREAAEREWATGEPEPVAPVLTGAVIVEITITVVKPKSAPKRRTSWPITRYSGDVDHHARAVLDSLSQAGIWRDDAQVVELTARKVYPDEGADALDRPGAVIRVWAVPVEAVS